MKNTFVGIFLLSLFMVFGQDKKVCFDENWKDISCSNDYTFYRIIENYNENNSIFKVKDYYKNGVLQMEGAYSDKECKKRTGEFKYYYENGNLEKLSHYIDSKNIGDYKIYYPNGKLNYEGVYKNVGDELFVINCWDEKGVQTVKDGNGFFSSNRKSDDFSKGMYKNGLLEGVWEGFDADHNLPYKDVYKDGVFVSGECVDSNNVKHKYNKISEDIPVGEENVEDFRNYVMKRVSVPRKAIKNLPHGIYHFKVNFIVGTNGNIQDITIENSLNPEFESQIVKVIKNYPRKFTPAQFIYRGIATNVLFRFSLPIGISVD